MRPTAKTRRLITEHNLDEEIAFTFLFAKYNGYPTHYFPEEYHVLDVDRAKKTLSPKWVSEWMKLWPTPSQTGLDYTVSGNKPQVIKKFKKLMQEWHLRDLPEGNREDIIWDATVAYLNDREAEGWQFLSRNHLFIHHDDKGSKLEEWIVRAPQKQSRVVL